MNQTDAMHPDQALLTFAGIFSYFQKHLKPSVAMGMTKRIEKHWKALNQPMFILALILNPFEGISCGCGCGYESSERLCHAIVMCLCQFGNKVCIYVIHHKAPLAQWLIALFCAWCMH